MGDSRCRISSLIVVIAMHYTRGGHIGSLIRSQTHPPMSQKQTPAY